MIKTKVEYDTSLEQLRLFEESLACLENSQFYKELHPKLKETQRSAFLGQIEELTLKISEYEFLISERAGKVLVYDLTDIPDALIRARLVKKWSQEQLAEALGIPSRLVQEYEDEEYADVDTKVIFRIASILGLDVPEEVLLAELSRENVVNKIIETGVDARVVPRIMPEELKGGYQKVRGILKLLTNMERIFGIKPGELLKGELFDFNFLPAATARFKMPANANQERITSYTIYVYHLANTLLKLVREKDERLITDPSTFRNEVERLYGQFTFRSCLEYIWDMGISVLPLSDRGAFHGATWRIQGRNVIVLKQRNTSEARWLFDLLHEYWHATQETQLKERSIVEHPETSAQRREDQEEIEANNFASNVLLKGRAEELTQTCFENARFRIKWLKNAVIKTAENEKVDVGALANNVAYEVAKRGMNWWGAANNLQQSNSDSYNVAKGILFNNVDLLSPALTLSDKEVFLSALDE
jgi:transcriptional regulator with XRE-family HTH domain